MQPILYIDMDNVLVDFSSALSVYPQSTLDEYEGRCDEIPGIFSLMQPMEGAIEAHAHLAEQFDTYILSTAPWENPSAWSDKLLWVQQHLGAPAHKRLILSHNKHLNQGAYLIDDRLANGADRFTGEHIHFGTDTFPDWAAVLEYLSP